MFCGRVYNKKINKVHERALRVVYNDFESTFEELLIKDNSCTIHQQNLHTLSIQIYKWFNNLDNEVENLFTVSPRNSEKLLVPSIRSVLMGENSIRYLGSVMWNTIPNDIRNSHSLSTFKSKIKNFNIDCKCRLCKDYIHGGWFCHFKRLTCFFLYIFLFIVFFFIIPSVYRNFNYYIILFLLWLYIFILYILAFYCRCK